MKDYQRLTVKNVGRYTQIKDDYSTFDCLRRLAELEDKIENGTLIPKYSVVKSCNTYCVCSVDTENLLVIDKYETKAEALKKLKELKRT